MLTLPPENTESCPHQLFVSVYFLDRQQMFINAFLCVTGDPSRCEEAGGTGPTADESGQLAPALPAWTEVAQSL